MMRRTRLGTRIIGLLLCLAALAAVFATPGAAVMTDFDQILTDRAASVVYLSADSGSTVIGRLEDGQQLAVLGETGSYYKIKCGEMVGYIAKSQTVVDDNGNYYVNCSVSYHTATPICQAPETIGDIRQQLVKLAVKQLGVPYVTGGTTPNGFDCSGFIYYIYHTTLGYDVSRSLYTQLAEGIIIDKAELQPGDLVFFKNTTAKEGLVFHVGMYTGDGKIIHAGSKGICVADLGSTYFTEHYLCARRVILPSLVSAASAPDEDVTEYNWWKTPAEAAGVSFFAFSLAY